MRRENPNPHTQCRQHLYEAGCWPADMPLDAGKTYGVVRSLDFSDCVFDSLRARRYRNTLMRFELNQSNRDVADEDLLSDLAAAHQQLKVAGIVKCHALEELRLKNS